MFKIIHPNRWFMWTIGFLLASGLFVLSIIYDTKQEFYDQAATSLSDTSPQWKVYNSKLLGISVRYPTNWQIEVDPLELHMVNLQNPANASENIAITVADAKYEKLILDSLSIESQKEITIDGVVGTWLLGKNPRDVATSNVVLVKYQGKLYNIAGQAEDFEQIVKSIKFTGAPKK